VTVPQLLRHGCVAEKSKLWYSGVDVTSISKDTQAHACVRREGILEGASNLV
jgi:hypothetical protein